MEYPQQNAYVCLQVETPKAVWASTDPLPLNLLFAGLASSETGYTITPEQQVRSSHGQDHVLSWKLELNIPLLGVSLGSSTAREALEGDGLLCSVVFVPADDLDIDMSAPPTQFDELPDISPLSGLEVTQLAPMRVYMQTDKQYGSNEIRPVTLTGTAIGRHKSDLHRVHPLETIS